jgi:hypothetical protein
MHVRLAEKTHAAGRCYPINNISLQLCERCEHAFVHCFISIVSSIIHHLSDPEVQAAHEPHLFLPLSALDKSLPQIVRSQSSCASNVDLQVMTTPHPKSGGGQISASGIVGRAFPESYKDAVNVLRTETPS